MFKLYFLDQFTGKPILRAEYKTKRELIEAWLSPDNSEFRLKATEEKEITNLPVRPRQNFQLIS